MADRVDGRQKQRAILKLIRDGQKINAPVTIPILDHVLDITVQSVAEMPIGERCLYVDVSVPTKKASSQGWIVMDAIRTMFGKVQFYNARLISFDKMSEFLLVHLDTYDGRLLAKGCRMELIEMIPLLCFTRAQHVTFFECCWSFPGLDVELLRPHPFKLFEKLKYAEAHNDWVKETDWLGSL